MLILLDYYTYTRGELSFICFPLLCPSPVCGLLIECATPCIYDLSLGCADSYFALFLIDISICELRLIFNVALLAHENPWITMFEQFVPFEERWLLAPYYNSSIKLIIDEYM